jgi:hypothetical protein
VASALLLLGQAASDDKLTTEEWLVPLISAVVGFAGALLGVVAGERLSRKTQLAVEAKRDKRERDLEQRRADEAEAADRRLVRAICRVLEGEFDDAKRTLEWCAKAQRWWADGQPMGITLPLDDRRLLASHLGDHAWELIALGEHALADATNARAHEMGPEIPQTRREGEETGWDFATDITAVKAAMRMCREARENLPS